MRISRFGALNTGLPVTFIVTEGEIDPSPLGCNNYISVSPAETTYDFILPTDVTSLPSNSVNLDLKLGYTFTFALDPDGDNQVDSANELTVSQNFGFCD